MKAKIDTTYGTINKGAKTTELLRQYKQETERYTVLQSASDAFEKALNGDYDYSADRAYYCTDKEIEQLNAALELLQKVKDTAYNEALQTATKFSKIK